MGYIMRNRVTVDNQTVSKVGYTGYSSFPILPFTIIKYKYFITILSVTSVTYLL